MSRAPTQWSGNVTVQQWDNLRHDLDCKALRQPTDVSKNNYIEIDFRLIDKIEKKCTGKYILPLAKVTNHPLAMTEVLDRALSLSSVLSLPKNIIAI